MSTGHKLRIGRIVFVKDGDKTRIRRVKTFRSVSAAIAARKSTKLKPARGVR